jgi:hypothetical protein
MKQVLHRVSAFVGSQQNLRFVGFQQKPGIVLNLFSSGRKRKNLGAILAAPNPAVPDSKLKTSKFGSSLYRSNRLAQPTKVYSVGERCSLDWHCLFPPHGM